jgi:hypothetical protein
LGKIGQKRTVDCGDDSLSRSIHKTVAQVARQTSRRDLAAPDNPDIADLARKSGYKKAERRSARRLDKELRSKHREDRAAARFGSQGDGSLNRSSCLLAVLLGLSILLPGRSGADPAAPPSKSAVSAIERSVVLPRGAESLEKYSRHYASTGDQTHRVIRGIYLLGDGTGVVITTADKLPVAFDGGCSVITVECDALSGSFLEVSCNGDA